MSEHLLRDAEDGAKALAEVDLHTVDYSVTPNKVIDDLSDCSLGS